MIRFQDAKTSTITSVIKKAKESLIKKNYNEIYAHEVAHKNTAGELGGSIHIVKNSDGIPISGFVPIKVPQVPETKNPNILNKTISKAKKVIKAAMAPNDPSSADFSVKKQAEHTIQKAESIKHNIDYFA